MLGWRRSRAIGALDLLWAWAAKYAQAGDVGRWREDEIAAAADADDVPEAFVAAMVECGLMDRSDVHGLVIHDWPDHCEDAVHTALARARKLFADGSPPKTTKLGREERPEIEAWVASVRNNAHVVRTESALACAQKPPALPCLSPSLPSPPFTGAGAREVLESEPTAGRSEAGGARPAGVTLALAEWWIDQRLRVDGRARIGGARLDTDLGRIAALDGEQRAADLLLAEVGDEAEVREVCAWAMAQTNRANGAIPWAHRVRSLRDVSKQWDHLRGGMLADRATAKVEPTNPKDRPRERTPEVAKFRSHEEVDHWLSIGKVSADEARREHALLDRAGVAPDAREAERWSAERSAVVKSLTSRQAGATA